MSDIITAQDLCLWYGDHQALKQITMHIPSHEITSLIGPSGCGKSTFLKTLNRMNDLIPGVRITGSGSGSISEKRQKRTSSSNRKASLRRCMCGLPT